MATVIQCQTCREVAREGVAQRSSLRREQQQAGEEVGEGPSELLVAPPCLPQTPTFCRNPRSLQNQ